MSYFYFYRVFHYFVLSDVNECLNSPCMNGATCVNTVGSFYCTCSEGWTGAFCAEGKIMTPKKQTHISLLCNTDNENKMSSFSSIIQTHMNTNRLIHLSPQTSNVNLSCVSLCVSKFTPHYQKMLTLSHDLMGLTMGWQKEHWSGSYSGQWAIFAVQKKADSFKKKRRIYKCIEVQM